MKRQFGDILAILSREEIKNISFRAYREPLRKGSFMGKEVKGDIQIYKTETGYEAELILGGDFLPEEVLAPNRQRIVDAILQKDNSISIRTSGTHGMSIQLKL